MGRLNAVMQKWWVEGDLRDAVTQGMARMQVMTEVAHARSQEWQREIVESGRFWASLLGALQWQV